MLVVGMTLPMDTEIGFYSKQFKDAVKKAFPERKLETLFWRLPVDPTPDESAFTVMKTYNDKIRKDFLNFTHVLFVFELENNINHFLKILNNLEYQRFRYLMKNYSTLPEGLFKKHRAEILGTC